MTFPFAPFDRDLALQQIGDWARAWIQNETLMEDASEEQLSESERAGLALLREWDMIK